VIDMNHSFPGATLPRRSGQNWKRNSKNTGDNMEICSKNILEGAIRVPPALVWYHSKDMNHSFQGATLPRRFERN
jgi:hypothetical protein